jgi:4-amino-4-deoxychorismate lyase
LTKPVFVEEIKSQHGEYFNLEGHAIRIDRTLRHYFGKSFLHSSLIDFLPAHPHERLYKCTLVYSDSLLSVKTAPYKLPTVNSMAIVNVENLDFSYKLEDRSELHKIREFTGADEVIIVRNGFVTNASTANLVFLDQEGTYLTPLHYIHSGTKRQFYLKQKKITTYPIKVTGIQDFQSVYLINSMIDLEDKIGINVECVSSLVNYHG